MRSATAGCGAAGDGVTDDHRPEPGRLEAGLTTYRAGRRLSVAGSVDEVDATGLGSALRQVRDPVLLFVVPVAFAVLLGVVGYGSSWPVGFDFRGTLWEPAHALLDGVPIYPEPTREAVSVGNPAVYPPAFILASVPLALLPVTAASWLWLCVLLASVIASMRIVGVRDWRCLVLAATSPVVVHGLWYGNLTLLLLLPLALAWRYREAARIAGIAVGVAVAAKLFVWPLVVWLLLTRRFRAAAWAVGSAAVLVLGAWAAVGFQGFRDYPRLLGAVQDVYAVRSVSLATVAGGFGAPVTAAVAVSAVAGIVCLGVMALLVRHTDGDRRAFVVGVAACVLASSIVWPNYIALLLVPIAVTWPTLSSAWFLGYAVWIASAISPKPPASADVCCKPSDVGQLVWDASHSDPRPWFAAGATAVVALVTIGAAAVRRHGGHGRDLVPVER